MKAKKRALISLFVLVPVLTGCREAVPLAQSRYESAPSAPGSGFDPDRRTYKDLPYVSGSHNRAQTLDLYLPPPGSRPCPLIIWIHGGAWLAGNKGECPPALFLPEGFAAASVNYRLSQEAAFPAQIHDCKAAVRFLRTSAGRFHIDPERIGVWGSSAGGHLAALLGTTGDRLEMEGDSGNLKASSRVQAVCDWCGPTDLVSAPKQCPPDNRMSFSGKSSPVYPFMGGAMDKHSLSIASPVTYVSASTPPFLIMHGDRDDIVPKAQSEELYGLLKKAGADVSLAIVQGGGHAFGGPSQFEAVLKFFKRTLANKRSSTITK